MVGATEHARAAAPDGGRGIARRAQRLRLRGHDGGVILPHRSIASLRLPLPRLLAGVALALGFSCALLALRHAVAAGWAHTLVGWMHALDLPGEFDPALRGGEAWFQLGVPLIDVQPRPQPDRGPLLHTAAAGAVWWLAGHIPDAGRPAAYLLRFAALIHAASAFFFALRGASFPHSLASHSDEGLHQAWALMLLTPWLHLATYYLFPFAFWQHAALSAVTLLWLALLTPVQYALHAALLHAFGPIVMPLLHLLFGVMVPILGFVALYGWAMSWPDAAAGRAGSVG